NFDKIVLPATLEVQPGRYRLILPTDFVNYIQEIEVPAVDNYKFSVDSRQYKSLTILGKPENATVKVGSDFYKAPGEIRLVNGKYDIQVSSPGYKNFNTTILLESDQVLYYTLEPIEQIDVLLDGTNTTVEFDGFSQELLVKRLMFTTIKQMTKDSEISEESVVWFGFSDGTLKDIPKSIPVALSQGIQVAINGIVHSGPTVIQVPSKQVIRVLRGANSEELIAEKPLVLDSAESCLVNIFSRSVLDVFVNGTYIGRTPIYLANLPKGTYTFVFKKGESELYKEDVYIENGKINEIRVDK
ncbi:MAG TPA: PEGA domain-containing protein, partial [Fervidobacterium sp.]|nr:PEGA domain-containing protein [Fervidobacterium sp.]